MKRNWLIVRLQSQKSPNCVNCSRKLPHHCPNHKSNSWKWTATIIKTSSHAWVSPSCLLSSCTGMDIASTPSQHLIVLHVSQKRKVCQRFERKYNCWNYYSIFAAVCGTHTTLYVLHLKHTYTTPHTPTICEHR